MNINVNRIKELTQLTLSGNLTITQLQELFGMLPEILKYITRSESDIESRIAKEVYDRVESDKRWDTLGVTSFMK